MYSSSLQVVKICWDEFLMDNSQTWWPVSSVAKKSMKFSYDPLELALVRTKNWFAGCVLQDWDVQTWMIS
jgi:hypothetical protein